MGTDIGNGMELVTHPDGGVYADAIQPDSPAEFTYADRQRIMEIHAWLAEFRQIIDAAAPMVAAMGISLPISAATAPGSPPVVSPW